MVDKNTFAGRFIDGFAFGSGFFLSGATLYLIFFIIIMLVAIAIQTT